MLNTKAYLKRIGIKKDIECNIDSLRLIQKQHLLTVPFENLDIHINKKVNTDIDYLFKKIVNKKRGGICYELNYLLYCVLTDIGFNAHLIGAKVLNEKGSFHDHVLVKVNLDHNLYLADVGFGDNFLKPLIFENDIQQIDMKGTFTIKQTGNNLYNVFRENKIAYVILDEEKDINEFNTRMNYFTHSEESLFKRNLFCSLEYENGRISLKQDKIVKTIDEIREEREINTFDEYLSQMKLHFGIELNSEQIAALKNNFKNH